MEFIAAAVVILLAAPVGMAALALLENQRAGQLDQVRRCCGGRLVTALCRALGNSVWSLWLTALALPFGRLCRGSGHGSAQVPVILVHGLYHNPAAWLVFRGRLARAGLNNHHLFAYASFGPGFDEIARGLAQRIRETAARTQTGRVLLVGHSLGGLVIRAACAEAEVAALVAGVVTLGTPHGGSTLANLALGRLGRGLRPGGEVLEQLRRLPVCRVRALSLTTPTDAMVLPCGNAMLEPRERDAGWREACLPPLSHVGLLYNAKPAALAADFLRDCARGVEGERG